MRNLMKKGFSLILVMMMVLSMSVMAYATTSTPSEFVTSADEPIEVNLNVKYYDENIDDIVVLPTETMTFDPVGFTTVFYVDPSATYSNLNKPTVMDALYKISVDRFSSTPVFGWDTSSIPNGTYITEYIGLDTVTVDSGPDFWEGYSWVLRINGQVQQYDNNYNVISADPDDMVKAMYYASSHLLNNPVSGGFQQVNYIEFSYELVREEW